MIKKKLLQMKKLLATEKMMRLVQEDVAVKRHKSYGNYMEYQRYKYYRAIVEDGILKVAVFERKKMKKNNKTPSFEIYFDKANDTWMSYEPSQGKWLTAKIDNLNYQSDSGEWESGYKGWSEESTKKIVNEYLGTGKREVKAAILEYQNKIRKDSLIKKHRTELEEIDEVMNAVPELPKDFDKWILDKGFWKNKYIFYHAGKNVKEGWCSSCHNTVPIKIKAYDSISYTCPHCHKPTTLKSWDKRKYLNDEKYIGIVQRLTDDTGYIYRKFRCLIKRKRENDWKSDFAGCWEMERYRLDNFFGVAEYYEWGEYKYTGVDRWCHALNHGYNHYYSGHYGSKEAVLYTNNLKQLLKNTDLKYMPVKDLVDSVRGCYISAPGILNELWRHPEMEMLIKAGLKKLTLSLLKNSMSTVKDRTAKKPWVMFGITKEQLQMCIKMDISDKQMDVLQISNELGVKLDSKQIIFYAHYLGCSHDGLRKILQYGHPGKFMRYFTEKLEAERHHGRPIQDYLDYLNDCKKLKIEMDMHTLFPKNFQEEHTQRAAELQEKEDRLKKMDVAKKNKVLQKMLPELRKQYEYESDELMVVLPTCKNDFTTEGNQNHNCVGGSYFDKMVRGESVVFFIRKKEEPEKSFCTCEMRGAEVLQCRVEYNKNAPDYAWEFLEKIKERIKKEEALNKKKTLQCAV